MKTNSVTNICSNTTQETNGIGGVSRFGRLSLAAGCLSLVSFASAPLAMAGGADGSYEFKSASGSLRWDGDSVSIPKGIIKRVASVVDGDIEIKDNTLKVSKKGTVKLIEKFGDDVDIDVEASARGPNTVELTRKGPRQFSGRTSSPIVTSFEGDVFGADFSGELRTKVSATVDRKTLTIVIKFSGEAEGEDFSGKVTVIAKK